MSLANWHLPDALVAVVDTETTGTDDAAQCIEFAWAILDVRTAKLVRCGSNVFHADANPAEAINGIPPALCSRFGWVPIYKLPDNVAAMVAHNAEFDRRFVVAEPRVQWLCTQNDWRWPRPVTSSKLTDIALAHGVGVTHAHRAIHDVLLLSAVLERVHEVTPLVAQLDYAALPRATYTALVSYENNHLAKAAGFQWKPEAKKWQRRMLPEEAAALSFKVKAEGTPNKRTDDYGNQVDSHRTNQPR